MSGADFTGDACGAQNPLMRLADHVTRDQSYRQEGLSTRPAAAGAMAAPTSIKMGALLENIAGMRLEQPRGATGAVASLNNSAWGEEFAQNLPAASAPQQPLLQRSAGPLATAPLPGPPLPAPHLLAHRSLGPEPTPSVGQQSWARDFLSQRDNVLDLAQLSAQEDKEETDDPSLREAARNFVHDVIDPDLQDTSFMNYVRGLAGEEPPDASYRHLQELDDALQANREKTTPYDDDVAFWRSLEDTYRHHFIPDADAGSLAGVPNASSLVYSFAEANEHLSDESDPFEKGEAFLREGNIPEAVLCFEAAVQQQPDRAAAWERLGLVLAENEQETDAIIACRKCLDLEPNNGAALISLARSFTNEMLNRDACLILQRWLAGQARYKHLVPAKDVEDQQLGSVNQFASSYATTRSFVSKEEFEAIESMLLQAVQLGDGEVDADLQIALGILYNISADFGKAVDCFETALKVRGSDALLWNKLGATLANSRRSELALDAYRRALELAPGFVRARSNLSVACIELNALWEACEHGLVALNLQANSAQKENSRRGDSIWSLLRMAVMRMGDPLRPDTSPQRRELLDLIDNRDLASLNAKFEIFDDKH